MTPASQRAKDVIDKVKSELTPIWLGVRQRMILEREIAIAIQDAQQNFINTHAAALLERELATTTKYREEVAKELSLDHDILSKNKWTTGQIIAALDRVDMREAQAKEGG
jgi:hypothetical protein